jgi:hypothetical protein
MWQAYVTAAQTADHQAPSLDYYAAGAVLSGLPHALYEEHQQGVVSLSEPEFHPVVTILEAAGGQVPQAGITDCAGSSHWLDYHAAANAAGRIALGTIPAGG